MRGRSLQFCSLTVRQSAGDARLVGDRDVGIHEDNGSKGDTIRSQARNERGGVGGLRCAATSEITNDEPACTGSDTGITKRRKGRSGRDLHTDC